MGALTAESSFVCREMGRKSARERRTRRAVRAALNEAPTPSLAVVAEEHERPKARTEKMQQSN